MSYLISHMSYVICHMSYLISHIIGDTLSECGYLNSLTRLGLMESLNALGAQSRVAFRYHNGSGTRTGHSPGECTACRDCAEYFQCFLGRVWEIHDTQSLRVACSESSIDTSRNTRRHGKLSGTADSYIQTVEGRRDNFTKGSHWCCNGLGKCRPLPCDRAALVKRVGRISTSCFTS